LSDALLGHASYGYAFSLVFVALQILVVAQLPTDISHPADTEPMHIPDE
jgi:hypothetical protein